PLSPANKLIFAAGPLTGIPLGGAARHAVGAKSPLTGGIAKSEAGEWWGMELKRSGFDALIIEGRAPKPVYLWIRDGQAQIRDAGHLWGTMTRECQETIRAEVGDGKARVAMIGPAAENLVKFACIMHGTHDAAGRGGLGAVMGSKNLKAVAVRGSSPPPMADREGVRAVSAWLKENLDLVNSYRELGTGAAMELFEQKGNLPSHNFRESRFPAVGSISPTRIRDTIRVGMEACYACPVRCKKVVEMEEPYRVDRSYGGPEYETIGAFGSCCGVDDLPAIARANALCNAYSLDTISTGVTIAFAMECFQEGLLTPADTGGIELRFGNARAMLQVVELIARREGIGELLSEGSAGAARRIGRGAEKLAMQVKGLEIPMHEPRPARGLALGYMVNPHGADHMDNMMDLLMSGYGTRPAMSVEDAVALGLEPTTLEDGGPRKVAYFKVHQCKRIVCDCLLLCHFLPYSFSHIVRLVRAVTGWETTVMEQIRVGERVLTLCRLFNLKAGFTAEQDRLPDRFFHPTPDGALADKALDRAEMDAARLYYYDLMGWGADGVPKAQKLEELGIEGFA
ncbi:MAG: aldehyde ferredoxin oxidoreductase family protein, partial [Spirochaetales bacterium]|nr:aldehyde ferredoxin oxidoreductase family protein [Spirochaetales bacterium]